MPENRQKKEKNDLTGPLISNKWTRGLGGVSATTPDLRLSRVFRGGSTFKTEVLHIWRVRFRTSKPGMGHSIETALCSEPRHSREVCQY